MFRTNFFGRVAELHSMCLEEHSECHKENFHIVTLNWESRKKIIHWKGDLFLQKVFRKQNIKNNQMVKISDVILQLVSHGI